MSISFKNQISWSHLPEFLWPQVIIYLIFGSLIGRTFNMAAISLLIGVSSYQVGTLSFQLGPHPTTAIFIF